MPHSYLKNVTGLIHVGANLGQERELYATYNIKVLWVEPLPDIFAQLCKNIEAFPNQTAINHLVTDKDDAEYVFNVANNDGLSSSILDLAKHREIWPDVKYVATLTLKSVTLDTLLNRIGNENRAYQALVLDTQGSELLVLKGSEGNLTQFKFIRAEAADFESYANCTQVEELTDYLARFGFKLARSDKFAESPGGGRYFDLLYKNICLI